MSDNLLKSRKRRAWRRRLVQSLLGVWLGRPKHINQPITEPPKTIAIVRPNHRLGNILMLTPLVDAIEQCWPQAKIDIIGGGRLEAIFRHFPSVSTAIAAPTPAIRIGFNRAFKNEIRHRYDLAINADPQSQSARLITKIIDAPNTIWPDMAIERHMARAPVSALERCLPPSHTLTFNGLSIRLTDEEKASGRKAIAEIIQTDPATGPLIGLYPFANKGRDYPIEWWQALMSALKHEMPTAKLIEILPAHGQALLPDADASFLALDLRAFSAQLSALDVVIATDGGVMHLAAASETLTWGLFQVTDPEAYAPLGGNNQGWRAADAKPEVMAASLKAVLKS